MNTFSFMLVCGSVISAVCLMSADTGPANFKPSDPRVFEMRIYTTHPGKLEALHKRFRDHTLELFEKHGMANLGYWVSQNPKEEGKDELIFVLAYPSREAREQSWKKFMDDPEWKAAYQASHADGPLVEKVESTFLKTTDYSPVPTPSKAAKNRLFELRIYKASPGNLDKLNARFRNHTLGLFKKHGMSHIAYWVPTDKAQGSDDTLIYIIAHESPEARDRSFAAFREDPNWIAAKSASEADGSLTAKVDSILMIPTDYSPIK
jgi:hypothetical protein